MSALLLQYLKLIMLFALISSIIGLSHFNGENRNGSGLAAAGRTHSPVRVRKIHVASGRIAAAADDAGVAPYKGVGEQQRPLAPLLQ